MPGKNKQFLVVVKYKKWYRLFDNKEIKDNKEIIELF